MDTDFPPLTVRENVVRLLEEDGFSAHQQFREDGTWIVTTYTGEEEGSTETDLRRVLAPLDVNVSPLSAYWRSTFVITAR